MFGSAKHIMTWLAECAKAIAKEGHPVMWNTPLGLPVVQPYRKLVRSQMLLLILPSPYLGATAAW